MAGGDALQPRTGVWWDLNTCPVPAGIDPRLVRPCIESALHKQIGRPGAVTIFAMGNLEYISSELLEKISSSGIIVIHAPCGGNDLYRFLGEWSELNPPLVNTMLISCDNTMVNPYLFQPFGFTNFCVYPKVHRPVTLDDLKDEKAFVKEFFWETLLSDNCDNTIVKEDECLCICDICIDVFELCDEFISHLKSDEHRNELFEIVPHDSCDKPKHFCQVCNYPAYDKHNMLIHNESEEHKKKMAEKEAQEEDCQSRKRNPLVDLFYERSKKQSFERGKQEEVAKEEEEEEEV